MTAPDPPPSLSSFPPFVPEPLDELLPGWPYGFGKLVAPDGSQTWQVSLPAPSAPARRTDPLLILATALARVGLSLGTDWTYEPSPTAARFDPRVLVSIPVPVLSRAVPPFYSLMAGVDAADPAGPWLMLEHPGSVTPGREEPPSAEPFAPVHALLADADLARHQLALVSSVLQHALCDTCQHRLVLRTAHPIRHRQPLHTSSTDESPDFVCVWSCGHQVLPDRPRCCPSDSDRAELVESREPDPDDWSPEWTI